MHFSAKAGHDQVNVKKSQVQSMPMPSLAYLLTLVLLGVMSILTFFTFAPSALAASGSSVTTNIGSIYGNSTFSPSSSISKLASKNSVLSNHILAADSSGLTAFVKPLLPNYTGDYLQSDDLDNCPSNYNSFDTNYEFINWDGLYSIDKYPGELLWKGQAQISPDEGLVLKDVSLDQRKMAEKMSMPYFNVAITNTNIVPNVSNQQTDTKPASLTAVTVVKRGVLTPTESSTQTDYTTHLLNACSMIIGDAAGLDMEVIQAAYNIHIKIVILLLLNVMNFIRK